MQHCRDREIRDLLDSTRGLSVGDVPKFVDSIARQTWILIFERLIITSGVVEVWGQSFSDLGNVYCRNSTEKTGLIFNGELKDDREALFLVLYGLTVNFFKRGGLGDEAAIRFCSIFEEMPKLSKLLYKVGVIFKPAGVKRRVSRAKKRLRDIGWARVKVDLGSSRVKLLPLPKELSAKCDLFYSQQNEADVGYYPNPDEVDVDKRNPGEGFFYEMIFDSELEKLSRFKNGGVLRGRPVSLASNRQSKAIKSVARVLPTVSDFLVWTGKLYSS